MPKWKSHKQAYSEALRYIWNRQQGTITSFKTPWPKVNDAGINGFEWNSLVVIGGRPGTGKTLIKDQIVREAYTHNKGHDVNVLEFSFEMIGRVSKQREFSSVIGKSYKYICSADDNDKITDVEIAKLKAYASSVTSIKNFPVDIVETPCTVNEFAATVKKYMEQNALENPDTGTKRYINTVITVDHSYLFKTEGNESKTDMLYNLGETLTALKRAYPICFIVLSQLGRHVEVPERNEDGKYGNYILETDILGGDALMQHADLVIGVNRPGKRNIKHYGPQRIPIKDSSVLVFHFIKVRNGDTRFSFFEAKFEQMKVVEMQTPQANTGKLNIQV
jgi:replicative DNA helicase